MSEPLLILIICISTILLAQVAKFVIASIANNQVDKTVLISTGGMPSSHSALVTSLMTAVGLFEGLTINFVVATVLALVVIHDAFGIRYEASKHAKILNQVRLRLNLIENIEAEEKKLKEALGHKPREVAVGIIFGIITALIGYLIYGLF